jgi:hypothetical protein
MNMTKRISQDELLKRCQEISKDNPGLEDFVLALSSEFIIKPNTPGKLECGNHLCVKEVSYLNAVGWLQLPGVQVLNEKKQWKDLFSGKKRFCCLKHLIEELEYLTSLSY